MPPLRYPDALASLMQDVYAVLASPSSVFPNGMSLVAGLNIIIDTNLSNHEITISAISPGTSGGAPDNATYITVNSEAGLSNERFLAAGSGIAFNDGGVGAAFTIGMDPAVLGASYLTWDADDSLLNDKRTLAGTTDQIGLTNNGSTLAIGIASNAVFPGLASVTLPSGNTADRPSSSNNGMMRYNYETNRFEGREAGAWVNLTAAGAYQPLDATLTALAAFNTNGIITQTSADTFAARTVIGTTNQIDVTNGDGVSGNPTVTISDNVVLPGSAGAVLPTGNTAAQGSTNGGIRYNSQITKMEVRENGTWNAKQTEDSTLTALAAYNTNGFIVQTGADTFVGRSFADVTNQTTWTNPAGASGNPSVSIANNPIIPGTAGMVPTSGTTAQRGSTSGQTRFNTTTGILEFLGKGGPAGTTDTWMFANCGLVTTAISANASGSVGTYYRAIAGTYTLYLPDATTCAGQMIGIRNAQSGTTLTVQCALSQVIVPNTLNVFGNASSIVLSTNTETWLLISNGSNWETLLCTLDSDLTALAAITGTGIAARTSAGAWSLRTITGTTNKIDVTNNDGVAGNPTLNVGSLVVCTNQSNTYSTGTQDFLSASALKLKSPTTIGANDDTGIERAAAGVFAVNNGTATKYAQLRCASQWVYGFGATPTPTVTPTGGSGTTWSYKIVPVDGSGGTGPASANGTTVVGAATLDATHYNDVSWTAVNNAASYRVYRTAVGTSPTTTGIIATTTGTSIRDDGLAGNGVTAPLAAIGNGNINWTQTNNGNLFAGINSGTWGLVEINSGIKDHLGALRLNNLAIKKTPTTTIASVVTQGASGSTTWGYKIVPCSAALLSYFGIASAEVTTTSGNGNATLSASNYQRITINHVQGISAYRVYRTTAPGTPSTTGLIGFVIVQGQADSFGSTFTFDDTGLVASGSVPTQTDEAVQWETDSNTGSVGLPTFGRPKNIYIGSGGNLYLGGDGSTTSHQLTGTTPTGLRVHTLPNANSNTVIPTTATTNQWVTHTDSSGIQNKSQPAFSNLSGSPTLAQLIGSGARSLPTSGTITSGVYYHIGNWSSSATNGVFESGCIIYVIGSFTIAHTGWSVGTGVSGGTASAINAYFPNIAAGFGPGCISWVPNEGAGGGGFGGLGGGGSSNTTSAINPGGNTYPINTFLGGSGGGGTPSDDGLGASGGAGGGGIYIFATGAVTFTEGLTATGGAGGNGAGTTCGGAGGGSGGAIDVASLTSITIASSKVVSAIGGNGGNDAGTSGGGGGGSGGRIRFTSPSNTITGSQTVTGGTGGTGDTAGANGATGTVENITATPFPRFM